MLHPTELHCTLFSYDAACWATLSHPAELCYTFLNYSAPSEQCSTLLSQGHSTELRCTLLSNAVPVYPLSCAAPYWAKVHPADLHSTPLRASSPLLSYAEPYWATLNPTELHWTLLSYTEPYWATLYPNELRCSMQHHVSYTTDYSLTELPSVLIPFCNFVKCRNAGLSGTGIRVAQSGTGMLRYRTEMLDAGIPMPAPSASMPMHSYANCSLLLLIWPFIVHCEKLV